MLDRPEKGDWIVFYNDPKWYQIESINFWEMGGDKFGMYVSYLVSTVWRDSNTHTVLMLNKKNSTVISSTTKIIDSHNKSPMQRALDFFKNMTAKPEEKLLKKFGLEDPIGTPTEVGLKLSEQITYKANRDEIIKLATAVQEEEDSTNKKKTE